MMESVANPADVAKAVKLMASMLGAMFGYQGTPLKNIQEAMEKVRAMLLWGTRGHHSGGF